MNRRLVFLTAIGLILLCAAARAEVKVVWERNQSDATAQFKFKSVPLPSKTDAANKARISIAAGEMDGNGGDVDKLNDGRLPADEDDPAANFFFDAGTPGGRLVFDLQEAIEIRRVTSYSWHPGSRGPQVYKLYGSDGTGAEFNARPGAGVEPAKVGWKLIASVDTRPQEGRPGGQYGVSIADSGGLPIGKYRYLLFDISRTESRSPFGNTFFSEIDVDDGREHAPPVAPAVVVATTGPATTRPAGYYEIVIDYSEMPELKDWVETKLRPTLEKWYPIIVDMLPSEGFTAPRRFTVTFQKNGRGVAATAGTRIMCAGPWFLKNLEGEAVGAVVHEAVHVVQQYRSRRNPGWLVEGLTDYIRWFKYEPVSLRPRPNPARAKYTDSYRVTAAFLNWCVETQDKQIIQKFNAAMRQGKYTPELWKEYTGKTVDELWAEYIKTLQK